MSVLAEILRQELTLVEGFNALLENEKLALQGKDTDQLSTITAEKLALVQKIEEADGVRNRFVIAAGQPGDRQGLEALLGKTGDAAAKALWQALLTQAELARSLNLTIGKLIATKMQSNDKALAVLTQHTPRSTVYGPNGLTSNRFGGRIIESA